MSWDRRGFSSEAILLRFPRVHLSFPVPQTQPLSVGVLGTPGRFLSQECRTLLMQSDLLSYHQTFLVAFFFFLLISALLLAEVLRDILWPAVHGEMWKRICRSSWTQHSTG